MKPKMEKMAKPATKLVALLRKHKAKQSLQYNIKSKHRQNSNKATATSNLECEKPTCDVKQNKDIKEQT